MPGKKGHPHGKKRQRAQAKPQPDFVFLATFQSVDPNLQLARALRQPR